MLDHLVGPYREEKLLQLEKDWILNMGTSGETGLNTRNHLLRGCSQIMSAAKGSGGVWKMLTMADKRGRWGEANADYE